MLTIPSARLMQLMDLPYSMLQISLFEPEHVKAD